MRSRIAVAAGVVAIMGTGACGADHVTITPTNRPTALVIHSTPSCDGTVVTTPYADFMVIDTWTREVAGRAPVGQA